MPLRDLNSDTLWGIERSKVVLGAIILLGFLLRVIFQFYLAEFIHYNHSTYIFPDTDSFTNSFINFWEVGNYSHDLSHPDAAFGRLPGYPVFFGLHYIAFGKDLAIVMTAFSQLVIDLFSIWLTYRITKKISNSERYALLAALIYSCNPFIIYWVPYICTESLSNFVCLLWVFAHLHASAEKRLQLLLIGVLCAVGLFIREYLGVLIAISIAVLWINNSFDFRKSLRGSSYLVLGFLMIYISWPIRNYYNFEKLVLIRPATAGYANYGNDMVGYTMFYHCWSQDDNAWYDSLLTGEKEIFPSHVFSSDQDRQLANTLVVKSRNCGTSYKAWMDEPVLVTDPNCNEEIYNGFLYLRNEFIKRDPWTYFIVVPFKNIYKVLFKISPEKRVGIKAGIYYLFFVLRSALIIAGLAAILFIRKHKELFPLFAFSIFMYLFICFYYRSLEMRYILQADILMIPAAMLTIQRLSTLLRWPGVTLKNSE